MLASVACLLVATPAQGTAEEIKCPPWVAGGLLKRNAPGVWIGKRSTVIDGDTVLILRARDGARVRVHLYGVDAPEIDQPYGKAAKRFLARSKGAVLVVKPVETDGKGRLFAVVSWTNGSYNGWLVKHGMAWANRRQGCFPILAVAEATARKARRGLWADPNPTPPWDWRKGKRPPPRRPPSKDRGCKRDADCVIAWRPCGYRDPICEDTWKEAVNRAADQRQQARWANRKPVCDRTLLCKSPKGRWLGSRAVCVKGQCTAAAGTARRGSRGR